MATTEQLKATVELVKAVADCIRHLGRVPSGHLYARLMGVLSLDQYQRIIDLLKKGGFITETSSHELIWTERTTTK